MMKPKLAQREKETLSVIKAHVEKKGYPPTIMEIGAALQLAQKSVELRLNGLISKGYISREVGKQRSIKILS